ncbi:MAG TPA: hypothetical protein VM261_34230 [Kofleriaceae bacterium]|nr:hypothetical protein [Kofleriaceae bacterium]
MPARTSRDHDGDELHQTRGSSGSAASAPGRSTLTSRLPPQRGATPAATPAPSEQERSADAHHGREDAGDPFGLHLIAPDVGGPGSPAEVASPGGGGGGADAAFETSDALKVDIVEPTSGSSHETWAPFHFDVFGPPNSTVVVYLTHYTKGKVRHNHHEVVSIDAGGMGYFMGKVAVDNDGSHHALHVRAQRQPGVFSPLRVVEFNSVIDTHGGGV